MSQSINGCCFKPLTCRTLLGSEGKLMLITSPSFLFPLTSATSWVLILGFSLAFTLCVPPHQGLKTSPCCTFNSICTRTRCLGSCLVLLNEIPFPDSLCLMGLMTLQDPMPRLPPLGGLPDSPKQSSVLPPRSYSIWNNFLSGHLLLFAVTCMFILLD